MTPKKYAKAKAVADDERADPLARAQLPSASSTNGNS